MSINHYVGSRSIEAQKYSQLEMDSLAKLLENKTVWVDIIYPAYALPVLVELGRHPTIKLLWSKRAWHTILSYRHWPAPHYKTIPELVLRLRSENIPSQCKIISQTRQYWLLKFTARRLLRGAHRIYSYSIT